MAFFLNTFKTIRNHWKKSIFFTCVGIYGARYFKGKYEEDLLRRKYIEEARVFSHQKLNLGERSRKVTVFFNPAASTSSARKLFEKNAAPLLFVAGLDVNVVETEYEGQIKQFMTVLNRKDTDAIAIAGGDGSLLEVVTGMMRKEDKMFRQTTPLGVIPVGNTNRFARLWFGTDKEQVRLILDSAMAIIRGTAEKVDVLKLQGDDGRTTFALTGLEAGAFRDAEERKSKYWYFGPLKHRFTYIRAAIRGWPPLIKGKIEYILAREDDGERKKVLKKPEKPAQPNNKTSKSWLSWLGLFVPKPKKKVQVEEEEEEEEGDDNEEEKVAEDLSTIELTLGSSTFREPNNQKLEGVEVGIGPSEPERVELIKEGWRRMKEHEKNLHFGADSNKKMIVRKFKFIPEAVEGQTLWFNIDGEHFEAMPIEVSLLKKRLRIFTNNIPQMNR